jgi:hypothetical protein
MGIRATATVTVEVSDLGSWEDGCTMQQVREQAGRAAIGRITNARVKSIRIIGEPIITAIIATEDRK